MFRGCHGNKKFPFMYKSSHTGAAYLIRMHFSLFFVVVVVVFKVTATAEARNCVGLVVNEMNLAPLTVQP